MTINHKVANARARVAALSRSRQPFDETLTEAKRGLALANLAKEVERAQKKSHGLTAAEAEQLTKLLDSISSVRGAN